MFDWVGLKINFYKYYFKKYKIRCFVLNSIFWIVKDKKIELFKWLVYDFGIYWYFLV